ARAGQGGRGAAGEGRLMMRVIASLLGASLLGVLAHAQARPPQPPLVPKPAPQPAAPAVAPPPPGENYSYQPEGRRDPFLSLLAGGSELQASRRGGEGPSSMSASEISVRGIVQSRGQILA